jgi:hypothetical protein
MNHIDTDDCEYLQEMRIILLGRTGGGIIEICFTIVLFIFEGKSVFGNSICGSQERNFSFRSGISSSSVIQVPRLACREYGDRKLCVIDTPGIFDINKSNDETMKQLTIVFQLATPGPHAFLIVLSDQCTGEEINVENIFWIIVL